MSRVIPEWVRRARKGTTGKKAGFGSSPGFRHGFRSGLEEKMGAQIEAAGFPVRFEDLKVNYEVPAKRHYYLADFPLHNGIILEGKGIFDATDRAKHLFIKAQYPELDIRFVFSRLKQPISPGSKTTVEDWCKKYGYKCCEKVIPISWFHEHGPERKPEEVLADGPYGYMKRYPDGYPYTG